MVKKRTNGKRKWVAWLLVALGAAAVVVGAGLVYVPAALVLGGAILGGIGLFGVEVGDTR